MLQVLPYDKPTSGVVPCFKDSMDNTTNTLDITEQYMKRYFSLREFKVHEWLEYNVPPILLCFGVVGNMLSVAVLLRPAMRRLSTYTFLTTLCFADSLALIVGCLPVVLAHFSMEGIMNHVWICKCTLYLHYVFTQYSSWLLVAVTVERYIAVVHPLKAHALCNHDLAYKAITIIVVCIICVNLHVFWTFGVSPSATVLDNHNHCTALPDHKIFVDGAWQWIETILYSFLPFVLILGMNTIIVHQVCVAQRRRHHLASNSEFTALDTDKRMTLMLLFITFVFSVLVLPINITLVLKNFLHPNTSSLNEHENSQAVIEHRARMELAVTVSRISLHLNHSINFMLYCAAGRKFRQELRRLCCRPCDKHRYTPTRSSILTGNTTVGLIEGRINSRTAQNQCSTSI